MPVYKDHSFRLGASAQSGDDVYTINQSIRFNDSDNPFMGRTPSSTGTEETWTWSFWIKRAQIGTLQVIFQIGANKNNCDQFFFNTSDQLEYEHLDSGSITDELKTTQLFRDTSAWYHIVLVADTTNLVPNERIRIYVNGEKVTNFATENYPTQNTPTDVNTQVLHQIGAQLSATYYSFDGYMSEIHLIDGYAYGPEYFGEFKENTDIWIPKEYSESYGTNGFKIDGRDASDLGDDESGNGNDYTTSGLASHDQVTDTPTNNFAVLNTLDKNSNVTLANGNLEWTSSAADGGCRSSIFFNAGNADKFYVEAIVGTYGSAFSFGISNPDRSLSGDAGEDLADFYGWYINPAQNWIASGSNPWNSGSNSSSGSLHVLQMAVDASDISSIKLYAGINDTYYNSSGGTNGNPSTGANPTATITGGEEWSIGLWNRNSAASNIFVNFGQEGTFGGNKTAGGNSDVNGIGNFFHSVPSGFKALCTKNLGS